MSGLTPYTREGDVRGFYGRLGVSLPTRATTEAAVRCFADPAAHRREDRAPSCSVNLISGAFNCHACGARGGAYDAAISAGLEPREAIDLMIEHGLTERRQGAGWQRPGRRLLTHRPRSAAVKEPRIEVSETQIRDWRDDLQADAQRLSKLRQLRGWEPEVLREQSIGWDGDRITIPVRRDDDLVAVMRYAQPGHPRRLKMVAVPGSRQALFPDPARHESRTLWLVEGHPDALAAWSFGLPAVAIPGVRSWRPEWARLFVGREVAICLDCDEEGRTAACRIADDLSDIASRTHLVELNPQRHDGYDLTDALLAGWVPKATPR